MESINDLVQQLADDLVELHTVGGIELEQWNTAFQFVKYFYNTEEDTQIRILDKKENNRFIGCINCGNDVAIHKLCSDCLTLIN